MSVLLVDEEPRVRQLVRDQLQDQGLQVLEAGTVAEASAMIARRTFSVVILARALPDGSGLDVLDELRASSPSPHVIILSRSTSEADHVQALQRGADDVVVTPFYAQELTARVLAARRRRDPAVDAVLRIGRLDVDLRSRRVTAAGHAVELTAKEFDLLAHLAARPGQVFSREQLLNAVWRSASEWQQAATVTEHVRRLRVKLEDDPARPKILVTVRGAGYRFDLPTPGGEGPPAVRRRSAPPQGAVIHVDARIVFCDQVACELLGAPDPRDLLGMNLFDMVAPTSRAAAAERLAVTGADGDRRSELLELRRADGFQVTVEIDSDTVDWHGQRAGRVLVTAVPDAPASLRRLLTGVLDDVTESVVITDLHGHVRTWNAAATRLHGRTEEEALGRHVLDLLPAAGGGDDAAYDWDRVERAGSWRGSVAHVSRDGSVVEVLRSMTLLRDDAGEPVCVVVLDRAGAMVGSRRQPDLALVATGAGGATAAVGGPDARRTADVPLVDPSRVALHGPLARASVEPGVGATAAGPIESDTVATLLRGLLGARSAGAAVALLQQTIVQLGGTIVSVPDADEHALPVDVSLGEGAPVLVEVERFTVARMVLERLLPRMVEDTRLAVDLRRQGERSDDGTGGRERSGHLDHRAP